MPNYLSFFDAVYYINLPSRKDRDTLFSQRANELQIPAQRYDAVIPEHDYVKPLYEGHTDSTRLQKIGCTLSHQAVIREAKDRNYENVLIFEDDCVFLDGFTEKLKLCVQELRNCKWDLFYMGGEPNNYMHKVSEHLYTMQKHGGIYTTHAYAVNNTFYDTMLKVKANEISVIDIYLLNLRNEFRKVYASSELLCVQDETYSDIWNCMTNSKKLMVDGWDKYIKGSSNKI